MRVEAQQLSKALGDLARSVLIETVNVSKPSRGWLRYWLRSRRRFFDGKSTEEFVTFVRTSWFNYEAVRSVRRWEDRLLRLARQVPPHAWTDDQCLANVARLLARGGDFEDIVSIATSVAIAYRTKSRRRTSRIVSRILRLHEGIWGDKSLLDGGSTHKRNAKRVHYIYNPQMDADYIANKLRVARNAVYTAVHRNVQRWWRCHDANGLHRESRRWLALRESGLRRECEILSIIVNVSLGRDARFDDGGKPPETKSPTWWPRKERQKEQAWRREKASALEHENAPAVELRRNPHRAGRPKPGSCRETGSDVDPPVKQPKSPASRIPLSALPRLVHREGEDKIRVATFNCTSARQHIEEIINAASMCHMLAIQELKTRSITELNILLRRSNLKFVGAMQTKGKAHGGVGFIMRRDEEVTLVDKQISEPSEVCVLKTSIGRIACVYLRIPSTKEKRRELNERLCHQLRGVSLVVGDLNLQHERCKVQSTGVRPRWHTEFLDRLCETLELELHTLNVDRGTFYTRDGGYVIDHVLAKRSRSIKITNVRVIDVHAEGTMLSGHRAVFCDFVAPRLELEGEEAPMRFRCPNTKGEFSSATTTVAEAMKDVEEELRKLCAAADPSTVEPSSMDAHASKIAREMTELLQEKVGRSCFGTVRRNVNRSKVQLRRSMPKYDKHLKALIEERNRNRRIARRLTKYMDMTGATRRRLARLIAADRARTQSQRSLTKELQERKNDTVTGAVDAALATAKGDPARGHKLLWELVNLHGKSPDSPLSAVKLKDCYEWFGDMARSRETPEVLERKGDLDALVVEYEVVKEAGGGALTGSEEIELQRKLAAVDMPVDVVGDVTPAELMETISKLAPSKAPGHTGFRVLHWNSMLEASETLQTLVCILISMTIQFGVWPSIWSEALLTLLPKGKGDPTLPISYRPISLLAILGKIAERIIFKRLRSDYDIIAQSPAEQGAYQTGRGALENIVILLRAIEKQCNVTRRAVRRGTRRVSHKLGVYTAVLDLSKAFDTVPHGQALLKSLYSGRPLRFLKAWLGGRYTRVMLDGRISEAFEVERCVPQGAVGSPPTFADFLRELARICRRHGVSIVQFRAFVGAPLFADDVSLISPDFERLNEAFEELKEWFKKVGMSLNADKCYSLFFPANPKAKLPDRALVLDRKPLEWVQETKYLGYKLSVKRYTQPHRMNETDSEEIPSGVRNAWYAIQVLFTEGVIKIQHAIEFLQAIVLGKLLYASEVRVRVLTPKTWTKFYNECLKYLIGGYKNDHNSTIQGEIGVPDLDLYVAYKTVQCVVRMITSWHEIVRETARSTFNDDDSAMGGAWRRSCEMIGVDRGVMFREMLDCAVDIRREVDRHAPVGAMTFGGNQWAPAATGEVQTRLNAVRRRTAKAVKLAFMETVKRQWWVRERDHRSGIVDPREVNKGEEDWSRNACRLYDEVRDREIRKMIFRIRTRSLGSPGFPDGRRPCLLCSMDNCDTVEHLFVDCKGCKDANVRRTLHQFTREQLLLNEVEVQELLSKEESRAQLRVMLKALKSLWLQRKRVLKTKFPKKK